MLDKSTLIKIHKQIFRILSINFILLSLRIEKFYNLKNIHMTLWNFTVVGSSLVKTLDETGGVVSARSQSFVEPSVRMVGTVIYIYEGGNYATAIMFTQIGEIDGVAPTDLQDAYDKLLVLVGTASGSAGTQYNNVDAYDEDATLPLTFTAGTIHSFSLVAKSGDTTITINGESTVIIEGQSTNITVSGLIADAIVINSTTGTFLATTLS